MEEELQAMKLGALSKRARRAGATLDELEKALDNGLPEQATIALIRRKRSGRSSRCSGSEP